MRINTQWGVSATGIILLQVNIYCFGCQTDKIIFHQSIIHVLATTRTTYSIHKTRKVAQVPRAGTTKQVFMKRTSEQDTIPGVGQQLTVPNIYDLKKYATFSSRMRDHSYLQIKIWFKSINKNVYLWIFLVTKMKCII